MTNKFHNNKFGIIQIGVEALSQTQILIHPNNSLSQIQNQRFTNTKYEYQIPNTKYELCTNQRKSHKSNPKVAIHQERVNHQTVEPKPSSNKPLSLFQIATQKNQITKTRESIFLTHTLFSFSLIFCTSTMLI